MGITIKNITDKNEWENFFEKIDRRTFLNSWDWGEFRASLGNKIWRRGVVEDGKIRALFLASKVKSRKGSFILLTHSPVFKDFSGGFFRAAIEDIKKIAKRERVDFIRIAPIWENNSNEERAINKEKFINSFSSVFPLRSWELEIQKEEEEILSEMRKGTRYMIRKAEDNAKLKIIASKKIKDLDYFYQIYYKTAIRQKFTPFSFNYIAKEFETFSKSNQTLLLLASYEGQYIAGALIVFWEKLAFYHHGGSLEEFKNIPSAHLIQWEAIKEAKRRECEKYNFWSIAPHDHPKHKWSGLTFFKKGFGGKAVEYASTKDLPLSLKYWATYFFEKIKE